jgi:RNA polymerase sigma-70 factor, ECF subfamily
MSHEPSSNEQFRILYERYDGVIRRCAMRLVRDHEQAEDVLQETMIRAWRAGPAHPPESNAIRCWLLCIARNIAIDKIRARACRPIEVGPGAPDRLAVGDCADRVVNALYLSRALACLSPAHRVVLHEVYFNGRTMAEAAAVLALPIGTVKSRIFYALRTLRLDLEPATAQSSAA